MKKSSGFKMKGFSGFGNSPMKVDLTKKKGLGPRATKKPFDRKKFDKANTLFLVSSHFQVSFLFSLCLLIKVK